nr:zinc finger, CCHC-type, retrotransposon Gag domain protein [Tanacetum cinerariifolium]
DIRNGAGPSGGGGDAIPHGIHVWIERITKLKPLAFWNGNDRQGQGQRRSTETLPPPPLCATCGKPHPGVCYKATGGCFTCGSTQHKAAKTSGAITGGYDWSFQAEEELINFALMAYSSTLSSLDSKVHSCSKECFKSYEALQKPYDQQHEALNKSNLEIIGYQMGLESLEAIIVVHEKNEAIFEEDIVFLKYDVQVKDIFIKDLKNQLKNALKEKEELKLKLEKFETSSKNLTKLINSKISDIDKTCLDYDGHVNESEVLNNVVDSCESDRDDNQVNDRCSSGMANIRVLFAFNSFFLASFCSAVLRGIGPSVLADATDETKSPFTITSQRA